MVGKDGQNSFVKICLPLDESLTALCSEKDEPCASRAQFVDNEKAKNEDYIQKIKSNNFFKKDGIKQVKLMPGEKIIANDQGRTLVLDHNSIKNNFPQPPMPNGGVLNPPAVGEQSMDPLVAAFRNRNNNMVNPYAPGLSQGMNQMPNPIAVPNNQQQYSFKQQGDNQAIPPANVNLY
jgi:hypothetical protein